MSVAKKLLNMTFLLFGLITLYCFVGFKLGYDNLLLVEYDWQIPEIVQRVLYFIIYVFQIFMIFSYTSGLYDKRIIKMLCAYIPVFILALFPNGALVSLILPIIYSVVSAIIFKTNKKDLLKLWVILIGYQSIVLLIKTGIYYFGYNELSVNFNLIMNIDYTLLIILFFLKGCINYGRVSKMVIWNWGHRWLCRTFSEENITAPICNEEAELVKEFQQLTGMERLMARIRLLVYYVLSWTLILIACKLGNILIEVIVILVAFVSYRFIIPRHWHAKYIFGCVVSGIVVFYIAAKTIMPFIYSQFFPIIIGFIVLLSLNKLGLLVEEAEIAKTQKDLERISVVEDKIEKAYQKIDDIL